jgi:anti-sigma-K factor RskA
MMTPSGDSMTDHEQFSADACAYVLGALELDELQAFRTHLANCPICRDEVASLQGVADTLPLVAPQYEAPKQLRRNVMAAVRAEPRADPAPVRRRLPRLQLPRPVLAGAFAVVLAFAVVGVVELASSGSSGVRIIPARTTLASATAQVRLGGGRSELVVRHFPPPPAGRVYQVWFQHGTGARPSRTDALFSVSSSGSGDVALPGNLKGVSTVMVTPEPDGGSPQPTHAPVIVAQLT